MIIAGGRDFVYTELDIAMLDEIAEKNDITEIISGGATGADNFGEEFAKINNIKLTIFKADWKTHGKAAGPIRNKRMAEYADCLYAFPGGRGTQSMINEAKRKGLIIWE